MSLSRLSRSQPTTVSVAVLYVQHPQPPNHKYQRCICHSVYYCSTECQTNHWPKHKKQHRIEMKSRVRLVNLKTVAMNGKCGSRREWNEDKGRFEVHLDDGRIVNVKPENLETVKKDDTKDE